MPWTPWIDIEPDDTDDPAAKALYAKTRHPITGQLSDLTRITSLTPTAAELIQQLRNAIYHGSDRLTAREKEIAALITSAFNGCVH